MFFLLFFVFKKTALQIAKRERPSCRPQRPISEARASVSLRSALIGRRDVSTVKTGTISWRRVGVLAKQTCWCLEGRSGESAQALRWSSRLKYFALNAHMSVLFAGRRFQSDLACMWKKTKDKISRILNRARDLSLVRDVEENISLAAGFPKLLQPFFNKPQLAVFAKV